MSLRDPSEWDGLREHALKKTLKRQSSLVNTAKRMGMTKRIRFINAGTIILDEEFYYYSTCKQARRIGMASKKYQMRGIAHFFKVFAK